MPEHIRDHVARAQARLVSQYRGKTSYEGVIAVETTELQTLEDVLQAIFADSIDDAVGADLDAWGRTIGQMRNGREDETYRAWLKVRLLVIRSGGEADTLIRAFQLLAPECSVTYVEEYPAALRIVLTGVPPLAPLSDLAGILQAAKSGGVRAVLEFLVTFGADTFTLDTGPGLDIGKIAYSEAV